MILTNVNGIRNLEKRSYTVFVIGLCEDDDTLAWSSKGINIEIPILSKKPPMITTSNKIPKYDFACFLKIIKYS